MRLFGTDGVRGKANTELSPELAQSLGRAAASVLTNMGEQPMFIVGRDTRISGQMLAMAFCSGVMSAGVAVWDVGILPTPTLAYLTRTSLAAAGAMISASHNPAIDNGIKLFSSEGYKLAEETEDTIERALYNHNSLRRVPGDTVGSYRSMTELQQQYLEYLLKLTPSLQGIRLVVDCAHGAAYEIARELFDRLGATVRYLNCSPDGVNINVACGSTHLEALCSEVVTYGADLGIAFDGDADRLIACDSEGNIVDGDSILAICGTYLHKHGRLKNSLVVGTIMSNCGLDALFKANNIEFIRTQVGDKYVLKEMLNIGAVLGAEQSGHCIFLEHGTTGDGLLTAVMLLAIMTAEQRSLCELNSLWQRYPQVLINVPVYEHRAALEHLEVKEAIEQAKTMLANRGRLVVRPSGTENLVRVMVEAETKEYANTVGLIVVDALKRTSA